MTIQAATTVRQALALLERSSYHPHLPLLMFPGSLSLSAAATTDAENKLYKTPMPHQLLGTNGVMVKVHRVSMQGDLEGRPDNAAEPSRIRADVHTCVHRNQAHGLPVHPPRAWPDFVNGQRIDTYSSINRTIQYVSSLVYDINQVDYSLVESNPLDPSGTICVSRGGSFVAAHAADVPTPSGLELEVTSLEGVKLHAVDAKLDTMVNSALFAPYLAGGFRISDKGARK